MSRVTHPFLSLLCAAFVFQSEIAWSHSEHGPYADFEAPGFQWTETPPFSNGLGRIFLGKGYGFIDNTGKVVLQLYARAEGFSEGLAAVSQSEAGGPWGYIDRNGTLVIPYKFEYVRDFSDGLAAVSIQNKWGYIDQSGQLVIPAHYDQAGPFSEGRAHVRIADNTPSGHIFTHLIVDKRGTPVVKNWGLYTRFSDGLAYAFGPDGDFLVDLDGRKVSLEQRYDLVREFSGGLAAVGINAQGGYIDKTGQLVLKLGRVLADSFHEGLAPALKGKRWGYIDQQGKFAIKPQFEMAQRFSEGLAAVRIRGKWGYISRTNQIVIPPQFGTPGQFSEGVACVQIDDSRDSYAYIDQTGKIIWMGTLF